VTGRLEMEIAERN